MNRRLQIASLILALMLVPVARAAPPVMAQTEINHLLEFVGSSGCEFYRNGSWYDSKGAQAHLRSKYQWLAARDQINTAEDFIEKAATRSSLSGQPYEVRCGGGEAVTSNRWLHDELMRYRTHAWLSSSRRRATHGAWRARDRCTGLEPEAQSSFLILMWL
jgi:Family of unknown function (DUF5329)